MDENEAQQPDERTILIHGFSNKEAVAIMRAVKNVVEDPAGVAFSVSTPTNLEWSVKELIQEVREEHEYMRENPPG